MYNTKVLLLITYTYFVDIGQNRGRVRLGSAPHSIHPTVRGCYKWLDLYWVQFSKAILLIEHVGAKMCHMFHNSFWKNGIKFLI